MPHSNSQEEIQKRLKDQLIEAMSFISEDRYCYGWMPGLSQALHEEGGIWEILGRAVGWPVGNREGWTWMSWDSAARHYAGGHSDADAPDSSSRQ